jgi:hypothetical protein
MKIKLQLIRNESDANVFTFHNEETGELILQKEFELNDIDVVEVEDTFCNFTIKHNGTSDNFDFLSASVI